MESFFATVKKEEAERFPGYSDAKMALFDDIEGFYNQRRRHSTLGQISPAAFERMPPRPASLVKNMSALTDGTHGVKSIDERFRKILER
jgi:hypothetical protein